MGRLRRALEVDVQQVAIAAITLLVVAGDRYPATVSALGLDFPFSVIPTDLDVDRPIWATAMYAGLRRGELRALRAGSCRGRAGREPVGGSSSR
jgi:hypothetical protein